MPAYPCPPSIVLTVTIEVQTSTTALVWLSAFADGHFVGRTLSYKCKQPKMVHRKLASAFAEVLRGVGPSNVTGERSAAETILALAAAKDAAGDAVNVHMGNELAFCAALLAAETTAGGAA